MGPKPFIDPNVEVSVIHSEICGQDFQLFIKLSLSYRNTGKDYPVLYCLDANRGFHLFSDLSLFYETPGTGSAQEIIIAGIGYVLDEDRMRGFVQWLAWRSRDLTPMRDPEREIFYEKLISRLLPGEQMDVQTGGAALFLRALHEEIIPFVESNYRATAAGRGLAGYSFGGLFTLYALFKTRGLFSKYFAGSPSMWECLFDYEEEYAESHADLPAQVVISAGSQEDETVEGVMRMADRLHSRAYPRLEIKSSIFDGDDHISGIGPSISRALKTLYYANTANPPDFS